MVRSAGAAANDSDMYGETDGFEPFTPDDMTDRLKSDFTAHYALSVITATEDKVQMRRVGDRLYSFDYSEAFLLSETQLNMFGISDDAGEEFISRAYAAYSKRPLIFDLPETAMEYHISSKDMINGMLQTVKRILTITDDKLQEMEEELDHIYPLAIGIYYECCISASM